jgi:hypothetical protein
VGVSGGGMKREEDLNAPRRLSAYVICDVADFDHDDTLRDHARLITPIGRDLRCTRSSSILCLASGVL